MSGSQQHSPYNPNPSPSLPYRASFSPSEQHRPPLPNSAAHYPNPSILPQQTHQQFAPNGRSGPAASLPPLATSAPYVTRAGYYDPVESRPSDMSSGWSQSTTSTTNIAATTYERRHSTQSQTSRDQRYAYGGESIVRGATQSPIHPIDPNSRRSYPLPSPTSASSIHHTTAELRSSMGPGALHPDYAAGPSSPTAKKATTAHRGDAMSISALLSNADEPSTDTTTPKNVPRLTQTTKRRSPDRDSNNTSLAMSRAGLRQAPPAKQATTSASSFRSGDADATDTELSFSNHGGSGGKNGSFRGFRYHDSVNLTDDPDKTDSELDDGGFAQERAEYLKKIRKRRLEVEGRENENRKRRRVVFQNHLHDQFHAHAKSSRERARIQFYEDAMEQVMKREEEDEKERKKEQQRRRRREKAEFEKKSRAEIAAKAAVEAAEREAAEKHVRDEIARQRSAERAARDGLDGALGLGPDMHDSDASGPPMVVVDEGGKKRKPGRKRQPKETKETPEVKEVKELKPIIKEPPVQEVYVPHVSKSYNQIFDQIWKDIARRDIPKVYRVQQTSLATKQSNLKKTAQLAAKEAQRWKLRTNKNVKDTQARAKRCMREMMTFWKRNEREERDSRRRAEKEALEHAKREEENREAKRQARKLNFLISQTELYSHFIGRKIKTDEVERSTDSAGPVRSFDDLDFDAEDDDTLHRVAINNAQHAIQAAQDTARAFNAPGPGDGKTDLGNVNLDEGEMNFQNPTISIEGIELALQSL
ncbi:unnamed protein product [Tuber melanosporum]|uniref:Chromatin-remodeling ATPase INO80 n=1 Tax=Tuber melanosporum (strain Mel28) TaxID=656061 RepID=D5GED5_TUBMM|nr:uncharacterized protein GSTUM_00006434001 [Tuber melanosporum]CAZ82878.1 unnamed protein product [Tuber melanosporum]